MCKKIPVNRNPKNESLQAKFCQNDEKMAKIRPGATERPYGCTAYDQKTTAKIDDFRSVLREKTDFR